VGVANRDVRQEVVLCKDDAEKMNWLLAKLQTLVDEGAPPVLPACGHGRDKAVTHACKLSAGPEAQRPRGVPPLKGAPTCVLCVNVVSS